MQTSSSNPNVLRSLSLLTIAALASPKPILAIDYFVPGDSFSIQSFLNGASSGDTIHVAPGTYVGSLNFNNKTIALVSQSGPQVTTIKVAGPTAVTISGAATIQGFTITGATATSAIVVKGTGTLIKNNILSGNGQANGGFGVAIGGNFSSPIIDSNIFRNNKSDSQSTHGVISFLNESSPLIINNIFENNQSCAIDFTLPTGTKPQVINNTIVSNSIGVRVDRRVESSGNVFRNNVITNNGVGLQVDFGTDAYNPTWDHNLLFANTTNYQLISDQTGVNGNLLADPLFAGVGNYVLLTGSPAIDAGSALNAPLYDFTGRSRPLDGDGNGTALFDIGAYEVPEPSNVLLLLSALALMSISSHRTRISLGFLLCLGSR